MKGRRRLLQLYTTRDWEGSVRTSDPIRQTSTEIWNPPMQNEMPDPTVPDPIVPGLLRKRARSSEFITSGAQPLKRGVKNPLVGISLERNARGLLADGTYVQDRVGRTSRPRVQITAGQTDRKMIRTQADPQKAARKYLRPLP